MNIYQSRHHGDCLITSLETLLDKPRETLPIEYYPNNCAFKGFAKYSSVRKCLTENNINNYSIYTSHSSSITHIKCGSRLIVGLSPSEYINHAVVYDDSRALLIDGSRVTCRPGQKELVIRRQP